MLCHGLGEIDFTPALEVSLDKPKQIDQFHPLVINQNQCHLMEIFAVLEIVPPSAAANRRVSLFPCVRVC